MSTLLQQLNDGRERVVDEGRLSLVHIRSGGHGAGAGTVWHPDGLILTNAHVAGRGRLEVRLSDGRSLPAWVLARSDTLDLAALAVEAEGLPVMAPGESRSLRPGQLVMALGHPWGVAGAAAAGVVIGVGSHLPGMGRSRREWVGVSLNLRPGNSGGPLIDAQGRLVGVNTVMTGPEVGLAVPVHVAKAFLVDSLGSRRAA